MSHITVRRAVASVVRQIAVLSAPRTGPAASSGSSRPSRDRNFAIEH